MDVASSHGLDTAPDYRPDLSLFTSQDLKRNGPHRHPALNEFVRRIPRSTYGGPEKSSTMHLPKAQLLDHRYIRANLQHWRGMIIIDADHADSHPGLPDEVGAPIPNIVVCRNDLVTQRLIKSHYIYLLEQPVGIPKAKRAQKRTSLKPFWYYRQVERGLIGSLGGDWSNPGFICKNPLFAGSGSTLVRTRREQPYSLGELASSVDIGRRAPHCGLIGLDIEGSCAADYIERMIPKLGDCHDSDGGLFTLLRSGGFHAMRRIAIESGHVSQAERTQLDDEMREAADWLAGERGQDDRYARYVATAVSSYISEHFKLERASSAHTHRNRGACRLILSADMSYKERQQAGGRYAAQKKQSSSERKVKAAVRNLEKAGSDVTIKAVMRKSGLARNTVRKYI